MKRCLFTIVVILLLLIGCGDEKNITNRVEKPVNNIISSIELTPLGGQNCIEADLCCAENITLHIGSAEVIVRDGINGSNINELKNQYSLVDAGNRIIAVVQNVSSVNGESIVFELYQYRDELINNVWSSHDLSAQIQNINTENGQFDLYIPQNKISYQLQFTKDELNRWEQRIVELKDNNVKIDYIYYSDIKSNLILAPIDYHIPALNDNGDKKIKILLNVYTVGAKTPYIRDRAVIIIKNDNGVVNDWDIVFERDSAGEESPFAYFRYFDTQP